MPGFFLQNAGALNLSAQVTTPNIGFRLGQVGALHAVLAHVSIHDDPASVCLPTGYGKTSVMMALPFLLQPKRVLVVEPSNALRKEVSSHYESCLRCAGSVLLARQSQIPLFFDTKDGPQQRMTGMYSPRTTWLFRPQVVRRRR